MTDGCRMFLIVPHTQVGGTDVRAFKSIEPSRRTKNSITLPVAASRGVFLAG